MNRAKLFVPLLVFALIVGFGYAGFKLNELDHPNRKPGHGVDPVSL